MNLHASANTLQKCKDLVTIDITLLLLMKMSVQGQDMHRIQEISKLCKAFLPQKEDDSICNILNSGPNSLSLYPSFCLSLPSAPVLSIILLCTAFLILS